MLRDGLESAGLRMLRPNVTFYCLVRCPDGTDSEGFARRLLAQAQVLSLPGSCFGPGGEGYVRLTVCAGGCEGGIGVGEGQEGGQVPAGGFAPHHGAVDVEAQFG